MPPVSYCTLSYKLFFTSLLFTHYSYYCCCCCFYLNFNMCLLECLFLFINLFCFLLLQEYVYLFACFCLFVLFLILIFFFVYLKFTAILTKSNTYGQTNIQTLKTNKFMSVIEYTFLFSISLFYIRI